MIWAITILFLGVYAALIFFYYRAWQKLETFSASGLPSVNVSVIVAARNEEKTLPLLVHDLAQQDYPVDLFEVIVVNDFSTDATAAVARSFPANFHMILPDGPPEQSSKKKAIATGISRATGELMVITDADCRVSRQWLSSMAVFYQQTGAQFIAAPVKYTYQPSLLQLLQVLDFITLQGITAASVSAKVHAMCNGANLAYPKKAFAAVNGFDGIDKLPTGDDMLLMHKIWRKAPASVFYLKSKEAIVTTAAVPAWRAFFAQRRRWASKTLVYDDYRIIAVLGFVLLFNLLPWVLLVAGIYKPVYFWCLLLYFFLKTSIEWPFVAAVATFYGEEKLLRYFALLQPVHVFYTVLVGIWSQVGAYEWKGRKASARPKGAGATENPAAFSASPQGKGGTA